MQLLLYPKSFVHKVKKMLLEIFSYKVYAEKQRLLISLINPGFLKIDLFT